MSTRRPTIHATVEHYPDENIVLAYIDKVDFQRETGIVRIEEGEGRVDTRYLVKEGALSGKVTEEEAALRFYQSAFHPRIYGLSLERDCSDFDTNEYTYSWEAHDPYFWREEDGQVVVPYQYEEEKRDHNPKQVKTGLFILLIIGAVFLYFYATVIPEETNNVSLDSLKETPNQCLPENHE